MKRIIILSSLFVLLFPCNVNAANKNSQTSEIIMFNFIDSISPYSDVIEVKYRVNNGITQYRRWNRSKGCWVDSNWINL